MDKAELMKDKITEQRKLPDDIKDRLNSKTFINLLISIALMLYLVAINAVYLNEESQVFTTSAKFFSMFLIIADVILFEIAYRKDSPSLWIHAIELLACSILVLFLPYVYVYMEVKVKAILMLSPVFLAIYYVGKTIGLHIIETKKYQNNLSDVKEIVKDDVKGYLEEEYERKENDND